ncbi:unnamed protein product [Rotaria socialis]|uniref:G-protein coupled receptors family 1 profile domain-containing protein n=1 Tax=Rotaria socialis TaxID=392032 RepID=A0A818FCI0_9BILA|nr:unnamed protein product [Rotaria socialis]CAF4680057.1 unnamed protein product [Rotaria socialis]
MLVTANHWVSSATINITRNDIHPPTGTNNSSLPYSTYTEPMWATLSLIIIILFTVCGNSLVCIAVIRERHLQNTTNYFLTSLAFTDCMVACLVMPLAVTVELIGHFPFNALACNVWLTFDVCCSTSSIWHMSVMSLDRYLTLRYPLKYGRNKRRSLMAYKIITIWLISFAICLPLFILGLVDSSNVYDEKTRACFPAHRTFKIYGSFVAFFIPLIIMIVTYALTMSALQQAYSTKKKRHTRRQKMHAVINLAAIAMRWKRAVNNEPIDEQKDSIQSTLTRSKQKIQPLNVVSAPMNYQRKRAASLLANEQYSSGNKHLSKQMFVSNYRLNEVLKPLKPITWYKRREKQLQSLPERSIEQSSPSSNHHLDTESSLDFNSHVKRSHSCTPLLDVKHGRNDRRRSSSVHALLQIRRDSAKISEEFANLAAQLSAAMNSQSLPIDRSSLSVPRSVRVCYSSTPTIDHLLVATTMPQPNSIPSPYLTVESSTTFVSDHEQQQQQRGRAHSTDIRLSSLEKDDDKITMNNGVTIPNLLITHDSIHNLPVDINTTTINNNNNNNNNSSTKLNVNHNHEPFTRRLTSPSKLQNTCQRIKDWITITTFSTSLDHDVAVKQRCVSDTTATESTPMLSGPKHYSLNFPFSNLARYFPRIEQLYGPTSAPNSNYCPQQQQQQQLLLVDDCVASVHNFAAMERSSLISITSSTLTTRVLHAQRPSLSSSAGSSSQQGPRKHPPRLHDEMSQASFQMVSLDTEDSSSGSSSLTHQSTNIQAVMTGAITSKSPSATRKHPTFRNLTKSSATNERKAMRVLLIIFSIFVILWTPFFTINLLSCFISNIHPTFISVATWLGYCSSGANPIIYTIFSRAFRRAFVNIVACRRTISSHRSQMISPSYHSMTMSVARKTSTVSKGQTDVH